MSAQEVRVRIKINNLSIYLLADKNVDKYYKNSLNKLFFII